MLFVEQLRKTPEEFLNLPPAVKRMGLVVFIYFMSWGLVNPFLSIFFFDIFGTYGKTTLITAFFTILGMLWIFPVGKFLDRFSQRKTFRFILLFYLPIWPYLAILQTFSQAIIYQIYHSITATVLWSSAETYNRTHAEKGKCSEAWGFHDICSALSLSIGALVGGFLLEYFLNIRTMFITLPPLFVIIAFILSRYLPKDPHKSKNKVKDAFGGIKWRSVYQRSLSDFYLTPGLARIWPFVFFLGFLSTSQMVMIPLVADALGATYFIIGLMYALFNLPILFEAPFSVLADTWSSKTMVVLGSLLAAVSLMGFGISQHVGILIPLSLQLGLAVAMLAPSLSGVVGDCSNSDNKGELNSVFTASQSLGGIIGLFALGFLADGIGIQKVFFISAGVMFISAVLAMFMLKNKINSSLNSFDSDKEKTLLV
ncbi:MAG: MFS transporter [Patescibacteria group bacterium]